MADSAGRLAGYAKSSELMAPPEPPSPDGRPHPNRSIKVYQDRIRSTHVGWMVPGRGFVPGEAEPAAQEPRAQ